MLPRLCALALVASCVVMPAGAAEQFPYTGYINSDNVYLRSGPGQNYYPTEKLPRGCEVEIWRHDPGGWFAVRPTPQSFSWISAEYLKPTTDGLAEITGDRVVVRIGSTLSDVRDVIQIHLNRGEEVEVIEAKRFGTGPAAQTWYKIAPPAGEFRWVHGNFVDREPDAASSRPEPGRNRLIRDDAGPEGGSDEPDSKTGDNHLSRLVEHSEPADSLPPRHRSERSADDDGAARIEREDPDADHESSGNLSSPEPGSKLDGFVGTRSERAAMVDGELDDINMALSRMVTEEPTVWSFDALRSRTEAALERGSTAIQRGRARLLLSKIERFEDIQRRMKQFDQALSQSERLQMMASARAHRNTSDPRFDGVGRLARVVSRRPGMTVPSYALTDPSGAIRYYVTPAPGVNLQRYVGREVGVSGSRGYLPELRGHTVTAQRVMPLDDHRWQ